MSERVQWLNHNGYRILSADYSGLYEADYLKTMETVKQLLLKEPPNSIVLVMANVTNTHASGKVRDKGKEVAEAMGKFKGQAYAVIGVTGIMKVIAKTFVRSMYFANSEEDAKAHLVEEAKQIANK
jgi:hypothetical protein